MLSYAVCKLSHLTMYGIHYAPFQLKPGAVIRSAQEKAMTYENVWPIYKSVAEELGLYFPEVYGYAYPIDKSDIERFDTSCQHFVIAPDHTVTRGNYHYSVFMTMDSFMTGDRSLPLVERLAARKELIRQRAYTYFTETASVNACELISDQWKVIEI